MNDKELRQKFEEYIDDMEKVETLAQAESLVLKYTKFIESPELKMWALKHRGDAIGERFARVYMKFLMKLNELLSNS